MKRLTVLLALGILLGVSVSSGQEPFNAYLKTGELTVSVDSLVLQTPERFDTIITPDFGGEPLIEDTFNLGIYSLPSVFLVFNTIEGVSRQPLRIEAPARANWYPLPAPGAEIMFDQPEPGIEELPGHQVARLSARPNPFVQRSVVRCQLARAGRVEVAVFDRSGAPVRTLCDSRVEPGVHSYIWDGRDRNGNRVAAGVYLVRAHFAQGSALHKLVLTE